MLEEISPEVLDRTSESDELLCFAHSLHLVVKDGPGSIRSSPVLTKCSALATLVHHSALFKGEFDQLVGDDQSIAVAKRNSVKP